jgi:hypothetical protein
MESIWTPGSPIPWNFRIFQGICLESAWNPPGFLVHFWQGTLPFFYPLKCLESTRIECVGEGKELLITLTLPLLNYAPLDPTAPSHTLSHPAACQLSYMKTILMIAGDCQTLPKRLPKRSPKRDERMKPIVSDPCPPTAQLVCPIGPTAL